MTSKLGEPLVAGTDGGHLLPESQWAVGERAAAEVPPVALTALTLAAAPDRDVVRYIRQTQEVRRDELLGLRLERMKETPFAFFRGTAGLMAADLAAGPSSGLMAQLCGDAHANNFGLYGTESGEIVMDINDFDETIPGPWEWDLKRLAASLVLAGREKGADAERTRHVVKDAVKAYRRVVRRIAKRPFLDSYTIAVDHERLIDHPQLGEAFEAAVEKARKNTSEKVVKKNVQRIDDHKAGIERQLFVDDEPVLFHVKQNETQAVIAGLQAYVDSVRESRRALLSRYRIVDVAFRVVGTGSVGMRSYIALLAGNDDEFLVLQVKQAAKSALAPYLPEADAEMHDGERIVQGARMVQARTDHLMGWTTIDERPFIVRQFRNAKGSVDPLDLEEKYLDEFGQVCGGLLARAHCRSLHPHALAGYLDESKGFPRAMADFAEAYADQVEDDYRTFLDAIERGEFD